MSPARKKHPHHQGEGSYSVGYGKPPPRTRFKPGQSGNPRGRPKGSKNARTIIGRVLSEKVPVREGDRVRNMSRLEAMVRNVSVRAMKGEPKAAETCVRWADRYDLLTPEPGSIKIEVEYVNPTEKKQRSLTNEDKKRTQKK